ncbi:MAG: succinate dehydrogenase/fumarate reductase iron-sulfur subunit [Proteobacteria bacterium]|nr:succinate dehydrogenase/fumarate reductase iron-sulfur subunit [Pseudomonadota bacterium]
MKFRIWRQADAQHEGHFETYELSVTPDMSLFDSLDSLNESLVRRGEHPVAFDSDCREGICGMCGLVVDGVPHGQVSGTTTCQLHIHHFAEKDQVTLEPFRAKSLPIIKDCMVDKSSLERVAKAGGYISIKTGQQPDAHAILIPKKKADEAFSYAACIGCGACVAACSNAAAHLYAGAKIAQLLALPQGHPERGMRASRMVDQLMAEGFGGCSNEGECEAVCPKRIKTGAIAAMQRELVRSLFSR